MGVAPFSSRRVTSTCFSSNKRETQSYDFPAALCNAVPPCLSCAFGSIFNQLFILLLILLVIFSCFKDTRFFAQN